jgi:NDP-sugar pyrophosphorylase family protein
MTIIVTMAGMGNRFRDAGYQIHKHLITARRRTLFEWSMLSLINLYDQHFIFATLEEHDYNWIKIKCNELGINNTSIAPRTSISKGQAETAFDVINYAESNEPLWIFNIDTFIEFGINSVDLHNHQGCVYVFESNDPGMSYVKYGKNGKVEEIAEKRVISRWATVGFYGFESAKLYGDLYKEAYHHCSVSEMLGERYIAPMYQLLIQSGDSLVAPKLDSRSVHILGTPSQIIDFDPCARPPFGT